MEPIAIAKLIYDFYPTKAKETITERFTNEAIDQAKQLWNLIRERLRGKPKEENVLQAVEAGDESQLNRLAVYIEDLMENPELAAEIQKLAEEIQNLQPQQTILERMGGIPKHLLADGNLSDRDSRRKIIASRNRYTG